MKFLDYLKTAEKYILIAVIAILPITVFSSFANVYETPKMSLALFTVLLLLLSKSIRAVIANKISFSTSIYDVGVFLFALVYIASSFLESPNVMDAFFLPGTTTMVLTGAIIYYMVNQLNDTDKSLALYALVSSAVLYSLVILLGSAGIFARIPQLPAFVRGNYFNTMGSSLPGLIFLIAIMPVGVKLILQAKETLTKALYGVCAAIIAFAIIINAYNAFPGRPSASRLPSYSTSWSVAIDAIKVSPLLGMGPGNYLSSFTRFLPPEHNQTDIWSVRFTSGTSYVLTMLTEVGIAGFAAFVILLLSIYKVLRTQKTKDGVLISLGASTVSLLLLPSTSLLIFLFFILLALSAGSTRASFDVLNFENKQTGSRLPVLVATVPLIAFVVLAGYYAQRVLSADMTYKKALSLVGQGQGSEAYDTIRDAIRKNPYIDRYRITHAQLNLAIANSIAGREEITDEDRNTVAQLVRQSIAEAKNAVALNPTKAGNWEVLGSVYRSVAPLADGAYAFARQSYQQAILLDNYNPNLRISLGGIFYAVGEYENAVDAFRSAVAVKPDHANSYYNLAVAYREAGRIDEAIAAMSEVLGLVERGTQDYEVASKALSDLQERKANAEIEATQNLTPPQQPDEDTESVIELDEEAAPPAGPQLEESQSQEETNQQDSSAQGDQDQQQESQTEPTPTPLP